MPRLIDRRILLGFFVLTGALFLVANVFERLADSQTPVLDPWLLQLFRDATGSEPRGPQWLKVAMVDVTSLGGFSVLTLITAIVAGYLITIRKAGTALFVVIAIAGGALISELLKSGFARARPDLVEHLVDVHTTSFPSAHAMNSAVTYLTLGALLARAHEGRLVRNYLLAVAIVLTLTIGMSRVYLGVHWPTDVLAGWCVGGAWALACSMLAGTIQRRRQPCQPA